MEFSSREAASRFRSLRLPPGGPLRLFGLAIPPCCCYKWKIIAIPILSRCSSLRFHLNFSRQALRSFGSPELRIGRGAQGLTGDDSEGNRLMRVTGNHLAFPAVNVNDR